MGCHCLLRLLTLGWPKSSFIFSHKISVVCLIVFNFIQNNSVTFYYDSCHYSVQFKKKLLIEIGEFLCSLLILKMEHKMQHFWHLLCYYFKKGKNITETQKLIYTMYIEGTVTDQMCQKWFVKFQAGNFLLDNAPQSVHHLKLIVIKSRQ